MTDSFSEKLKNELFVNNEQQAVDGYNISSTFNYYYSVIIIN